MIRRLRLALSIGLVALAFAWPRVAAATEPISEYALKAAFVFHFTQFVDWPDSAFSDAAAPFVIGVLGDNPFGESLAELVEDETFHGRRIVVWHGEKLAESKGCQILFISRSEEAHLERVLDTVHGGNVLTVGDIEGFSAQGGVIGFEVREKRLRLKINVAHAKASGLVISSKLLRQADVEGTEP